MTFKNGGRGVLAIFALACLGAILVAGCGGSGDSSSSGDSGSASETDTGSEANTGSEAGTGKFPEAEKKTAALEKRPTSIGIDKPVGKPIPKGKVIDFVQCGVPACETERAILQQATDLLGWTLKPIDSGVTPEEIKAAYDQAIKDEPDAVLSSGNPRALFEPELKTLAQMKIPVVQAFVGDKPGNGITGVVGGPEASEIEGAAEADYILSHSESEDTKVGLVYVNGFETTVVVANSLKKELEAQCGGCSTAEVVVPVSSIGADLPQRVSSFLTSNPDVEWSSIAYSDLVVGLPTALKGAGVENAKLVTLNLSPAIAPYMAKGEYLQMGFDVSFPEAYWREIDLLARYFTGQPYDEDMDDSTLPYWAVTADSLPSSTEEFPAVVDYEAQYKKLWGLG
jgi:ribose transport system substrate-binding protein